MRAIGADPDKVVESVIFVEAVLILDDIAVGVMLESVESRVREGE